MSALSYPATAADRRLDALLLRYEIESFNNRYAQLLDEQNLMEWAEMFTDDALYVVLSRENEDRGLPAGVVYCENKAMLRDRAFAIKSTTTFAPRYLRHIISNLEVGAEEDGVVPASANYLLMQVLFDKPDATIHQLGQYKDVFRRVDGVLKLAERRCIYDSLLIPNALCLPV
jgi:anthranilate 1,2-dioxygenase small subunit